MYQTHCNTLRDAGTLCTKTQTPTPPSKLCRIHGHTTCPLDPQRWRYSRDRFRTAERQITQCDPLYDRIIMAINVVYIQVMDKSVLFAE